MNIKHYVINLKRRPDKLWAWIGAMDRHNFPLNSLTVVEAIDAKSFPTLQNLFEYAIEMGFNDYKKILERMKREDLSFGKYVDAVISLKLSISLILLHISNQDEHDWSTIWLDDILLIEHYGEFQKMLQLAPKETKAIFPAKSKGWENRNITIHKGGNFYNGTIGNKSDHCLVINKIGADHLLKIGNRNLLHAYETCMLHYPDQSNLFTYIKDITEHVEYYFPVSSDIFGESKDRNLPFKVLNHKDLP